MIWGLAVLDPSHPLPKSHALLDQPAVAPDQLVTNNSYLAAAC